MEHNTTSCCVFVSSPCFIHTKDRREQRGRLIYVYIKVVKFHIEESHTTEMNIILTKNAGNQSYSLVKYHFQFRLFIQSIYRIVLM